MEALLIGILTTALFAVIGLLGTALFQLRGDMTKLAERLAAVEAGLTETRLELRGEVEGLRGEIEGVRGEIAGLRTAFEAHVAQHA